MEMPPALAYSCDTYFYRLGNAFYALPTDRGHPLQRGRAAFGFGARPALDIGPEARGLLPTTGWRAEHVHEKTDPCAGGSTGSGSPETRSSSRSARRTCS